MNSLTGTKDFFEEDLLGKLLTILVILGLPFYLTKELLK